MRKVQIRFIPSSEKSEIIKEIWLIMITQSHQRHQF